MFEGSLVESRGLVASKTQKWSTVGSFAVQGALAALLIAIPTLKPEVLPTNVAAPKITVPNLRPVHLEERVRGAAISSGSAVHIPASAPALEHVRGTLVFPMAPATGDSDPAPFGAQPMAMGSGQGSIASLVGIGSTGPATVRVRDTRPVRVSQGVSDGMLLAPIVAVYPPIAKAAGIQGTVVIEAVISKAGRVESLNVVSGHPMLRGAALDAVRQARYAPYKLSGEPVEVQTVITVVFRMG